MHMRQPASSVRHVAIHAERRGVQPIRIHRMGADPDDGTAQVDRYFPVDYVYGQIAVADRALSQGAPDVAGAREAIGKALNKIATRFDGIDSWHPGGADRTSASPKKGETP